MSTPTCRLCYIHTLGVEERALFLAEPVTTSVHYCPEHQRVINNLLTSFDWDTVRIHGSVTGRFTSTTSNIKEIERA